MTDSSSFDLCRVLFFGHHADRIEVHTLRGGDWQTDVVRASPRLDSGSQSRFVAIEVDDAAPLREHLEERLADLEESGFGGCYILVPNRSAADIVSQMLIERSLGPFGLYGIDPDYYHGIVPLTGDNHRQIESFVLGLKPTSSFTARVRHWVKHTLIRTGLSNRLYEAFLIVLEGPSCS
ncbi:MAG: hypothetical protein WBH85_05515 [Thermoanaerobaculia bacterium]